MTPYGCIHQTMKVEDKDFEVQHPWAMLFEVCRLSTTVSAFILELYAAKPCTKDDPWHLIVYNDEVSPGNQLKAINSRKLQAFYWSIRELSHAILWDEEAEAH